MGRTGVPGSCRALPLRFGGCFRAPLETIMAQNDSVSEQLKSKAGAVFWVVLVGCTQKKAGCVPPKLLTQVWGADSATLR